MIGVLTSVGYMKGQAFSFCVSAPWSPRVWLRIVRGSPSAVREIRDTVTARIQTLVKGN